MIDRIILNIPHSSAEFPAGAKARWEGDVDTQIQRWTDWYTGHLFGTAALKDPRIRPVVFPWSRFFCDVERLEDDPLEKKGQGLAYTNFEGCVRRLSEQEKERIYRDYYLEHMAAVMKELTPTSMLIDCHSFPSDLSDVEVCIGINPDWSMPDKTLLIGIKYLFELRGYKTEFNNPHSNSYAPEMHFPYPSLMIELNKSTYMTPDGQLDHARAERLQLTIEQLYDRILSPWVREVYNDNFMLLYDNREIIWKNPRMASALIGMEQFSSNITLGGYLLAVEQNPELFRRKRGVIISFVGHPLIGPSSSTLLNLKTGRTSTLTEYKHKELRAAVQQAMTRFPSLEGALPLSTVVEMLKKGDR